MKWEDYLTQKIGKVKGHLQKEIEALNNQHILCFRNQ
jgi:hypothetical protein